MYKLAKHKQGRRKKDANDRTTCKNIIYMCNVKCAGTPCIIL